MSTRLYASNLPFSATEARLAISFAKFGVVLSVRLDQEKSGTRPSAFVEMQTSAEAQRAIAGLNLAEMDGRLISVYKALAPVPVVG